MNRSQEDSKKWRLPRFSKAALLILLAIAVVVTGITWSKISAAKPTNPIASQFKAHHVALRVPNLEKATCEEYIVRNITDVPA